MCWRKYPLKIRFNGGQSFRGVPICELSATLTSIQRMVCRTYLLTEQGKANLACMPQDERLHYSLRLVSKAVFSKTFYLDWSSKATSVETFEEKQAIKALLSLHEALQHYENTSVELKPDNPAGRLALAIYNDVHDISNRLGQVENIRSIEIRVLGKQPCRIDKKVAAYIEELKGETYDMAPQDLQAVVVAPRAHGRDYAVIRSATHQVKIYADNEADSIKFLDGLMKVLSKYPAPKKYQPRFVFTGKPRYKIGGDPSSYSDFVLTSPESPIRYVTKSGKMSEQAI